MSGARTTLLRLAILLLVGVSTPRPSAAAPADPLPSWRDGPAKQAILGFVERVTRADGPEFVPEPERVAVFDNDGTLWVEQPAYAQVAFAVDRVRALAPRHPEWATREPFRSVLAGDVRGAFAQGERSVLDLLVATHTGVSTAEFEAAVSSWIATARHPTLGRPYVACVYRPMLELMRHLRAAGFQTWIVTGGGVEFLRPWVERTYGVPPERVVGSRVKVRYEPRDGGPVLLRLPEADLVDDGPGKPVGIHQQIGRRPIAAFGNSDGDFEMLEWTTAAPGPRLGAILRHTDGEREWKYDRGAPVGRLERALDAAPAKGWLVIDMKADWEVVFP